MTNDNASVPAPDVSITFVRELTPPRRGASQCLVSIGDDYFVVSSIASAFDTGLPETLVFPGNAEGDITSWGDVAGGRNVSREDAILDLARHYMEGKVTRPEAQS